jgi:hypothetical protein
MIEKFIKVLSWVLAWESCLIKEEAKWSILNISKPATHTLISNISYNFRVYED